MKNSNYKYIVSQSTQISSMDLKSAIDEHTSRAFVEEFKYLETKSDEIHIRLNSVGGSVIAGYDIFSTILSSPTKTVITVEGIAASMGSVIMFSGDEIKMTDYSLLMVHNPFFPTNSEPSEKEQAVLDKFKTSLLTIYQKRTGLSKAKISKMMDEETWLDARECLKMGLIDEIIETEISDNKKNKIKDSVISEYALIKNSAKINFDTIYNKVLNEDENKIQNMELYKILNVTDEATALVEVQNLQASIADTITQLEASTAQVDELNAKVSDLEIINKAFETEIENKTSVITALEAKVKAFEDAEAERKVTEATTLVDNAIADRKIKASAKDEWLKLALANFDSVSTVINSISKSVKFSEELETEDSTESPKVKKSKIKSELELIQSKSKNLK